MPGWPLLDVNNMNRFVADGHKVTPSTATSQLVDLMIPGAQSSCGVALRPARSSRPSVEREQENKDPVRCLECSPRCHPFRLHEQHRPLVAASTRNDLRWGKCQPSGSARPLASEGRVADGRCGQRVPAALTAARIVMERRGMISILGAIVEPTGARTSALSRAGTVEDEVACRVCVRLV